MSDEKKSLKDQLGVLTTKLQALQKYSFIGFVVFLCAIYGFLLFRITMVVNEQPSAAAIDDQVKGAHVPKIDQKIVQQLQTLQDNSVSVKALFEETRNNPFNQ
jgi:hypothetical protein